jgi:hypothetical protein
MAGNDSFSGYQLWLLVGTAILLIIVVAALASWLNNRKSGK